MRTQVTDMKRGSNASRAFLYSIESLSGLAFGLFGTSLVAKAYGPELFGDLGFAQAVSSSIIFLATLGFDSLILRDLSRHPQDASLRVGALLAQIGGWIIYCSLFLSIYVWNGRFQADWPVVASLAFTTLFARSLYFKIYFQAVDEPKGIAAAAITSRAIALAYVISAVHLKLPYGWVLTYMPLQASLQAGILYLLMGRSLLVKTSVSVRHLAGRVKTLLRESTPMLLANAAHPLFMSCDVLLVSYYLDAPQVGMYVAAMKLIPQLGFAGQSVFQVFNGKLIAYERSSVASYHALAKSVGQLILIVAVLGAATVALLSESIIKLLYGRNFADSTVILQIGVLIWPFLLPSHVYSRMLVIEGLGKYELYRTLITGCTCVLLNVVFIKRFGAPGAAVVAVIGYLMADFLTYGLFRKTRHIFCIILASYFELFTRPLATLKSAFGLLGRKID